MGLLRPCLLLVLSVPLLTGQQPATGNPNNSPPQTQPTPPRHKETVVVTGTTQPLPLDEADRSVNVYDLPARVMLFGNLGDVLQLDSSVDLQPRAAGVQGDISIRGGSFGQTLVLVNGIRVDDAQSAHHNFDIPAPIDAIDRVEILRGSGSTLYGADATAGVVNVITRIDDQRELRFRMGIGSFGTNTQSGFFSFGAGPLSQQFSFERELSTGFRPDRDYRNLSASSETHVRTALGVTSIYLAGLDRPFGADQFYGDYPSWERTKTWFASLRQDLGSNMDFSFAYRRHTDLFVLFRDHPEIYTNHHADETWDAALRRHDDLASFATLSYGAEGIADSIDSTNLGNHHRNRGAVYAHFDARALRRFSFSLGGREEFFGHGERVFTPSVSGGVWLSSKVKLRASASRAFRLPSYTDLYYSDPANLGNPNLKPEKAMGYEGGLDWHPGTRWRVSGTVFQRREKNDIDYVRNSPADIWRATNFDSLNFTGVEAAVEGQLPHSQQVGLQYTALHGAKAVLGTLQSKYVFNYPSNQAIASWQMLAHNGILARTRLGVTDRIARPVYALWDVDVAWTHYRVRPYMQLSNLTDASYQELAGIAMPGRSALVGIEFCIICAQR